MLFNVYCIYSLIHTSIILGHNFVIYIWIIATTPKFNLVSLFSFISNLFTFQSRLPETQILSCSLLVPGKKKKRFILTHHRACLIFSLLSFCKTRSWLSFLLSILKLLIESSQFFSQLLFLPPLCDFLPMALLKPLSGHVLLL